MDITAHSRRPVLLAAFKSAAELGLTVPEVVAALEPSAKPPAARAAGS